MRSSLVRFASSHLKLLFVAVMIGSLLAGCSSDDNEDTPTATVAPPTASAIPPTVTATAAAAVATVASTVIPGSGQIISDGICQANVPDEWVDDTTGHGSTASGAKYAIFGGRVRSDDAWTQAVALVKQQAGSKAGANVTESDNSIRVDFANNTGFEYRVRLDTIYCDVSVTSTKAVPDDERALWDGIIASLAPKAP